MRRIALLACLPVVALALAWSAPARAGRVQYVIETRSPDSWAHYYQRIGLGTVHRGPHSREDWTALTTHCDFLEDVTGHPWIPLGYSIEKGYKLCFRTGPFTAQEAKVFCARLVMEVRQNTAQAIVCEKEKDNLLSPRENPYY